MLVSESNLFRQRGIDIELNISSMDGKMCLVKVRNESNVDQLKVLVASQICGSDCENVKEAIYYKLLHVQSSRMLDDDKTLRQQGVTNNDELLLVKRRIKPSSLLLHTKDDSKQKLGADVVNKDLVREATKDLSSVNAEREDSEINPHGDFLSELRKIVISLIDAAQKILCLNPEASKIFDEAEKYMADQKTPQCTIDEVALQQLKDMGFAEARAKKALLINRMAAPDAIQWLLEHDSDPDIDTPLPGMEDVSQEQADIPGAVGGLPNGDVDTEFSKISGPKKIIRMLESFRAYRRKEFKPNPQVLRSLMEMGFEERDVIDALRIHNNRENEACDWLLSGEDRKILDTNLDEGLDPDSEVYKAIMSNSVVQLGLSNPKSLTALLHMLENPSSTHQWLNDPDTGPMIIQISRIYHADKYGKKKGQKAHK